MPTYDYECLKCHRLIEEQRTIDDRLRRPRCKCGALMKMVNLGGRRHITPDFEPYHAVGKERGKLIKTRAQHRDYLKKHNYEEVGNDASMAPPKDDPDRDAARAREAREAFRDMGIAAPHLDRYE